MITNFYFDSSNPDFDIEIDDGCLENSYTSDSDSDIVIVKRRWLEIYSDSEVEENDENHWPLMKMIDEWKLLTKLIDEWRLVAVWTVVLAKIWEVN